MIGVWERRKKQGGECLAAIADAVHWEAEHYISWKKRMGRGASSPVGGKAKHGNKQRRKKDQPGTLRLTRATGRHKNAAGHF